MARAPAVMALYLAMFVAVHGCPLLTSEGLVLKKAFTDVNTWIAEVPLTGWRPGVLVTIIFPNDSTFHDAHATQAAFASIERDSPRVAVLKLLDRPSSTSYRLTVEGTGGCWGAAGMSVAESEKCKLPLITCDMAPAPDPPPSAPPSLPPPPIAPTLLAAPRITKACGDTVSLEWDPPAYTMTADATSDPLEYEVNALAPGRLQPIMVAASEPHAHVRGLSPGISYSFAVGARRTGRSEMWKMSPWVQVQIPSDTIDAHSLAIVPSASIETCDSLELTLPTLPPDPWKCRESDFLSVEWRVAKVSERWQPILDRVDEGDLPNNLLVVDQLDAYETFEFRVLLHHLAPGGNSGEVIAGPGTGALLVGMLRNELINAPTASASSSASVDIALPQISHCRESMQQLLWYATGAKDGEGEDDWQLLDTSRFISQGRHVHVNTLRCPDGCRFRWSTDDIKGWDDASAVSTTITTPQLPAPEIAMQRLELKLGSRSEEARITPSAWRQRFGEELSSMLGLDSSSVDVVEVRAEGEYVTFDVPRPHQSAEGSPPPPSSADVIVHHMMQPACTTNLALSQPGRCSSSCGNATSPAFVNDGDLRQYAPHVWQSCENDHQPWWAVQLPRTMSRTFVRVLVGDCCAQAFDRSIDIHLGPDSGPTSKCTTIVVDDGSAVGAYCEGEGDWVTVVAQAPFALAEIQVCDASDVNTLLRGELLSAVDTSAGVVELRDGTQVHQLAPTLLSMSSPGRDATWRHSSGARSNGLMSPTLRKTALPLLVVLALFIVVVYILRRLCSRRSFARVSRTDQAEGMDGLVVGFDDDDFFDDDATAQSPRFVGKGTMPVTFERGDGTQISASVNLSGVTSMGQIFAAVKGTATKALGGGPVEHFSLQYMNESRQFEEAWYDPILREGSEIRNVVRASQWRVLILGESIEMPSPPYRHSTMVAEEGLISVAL